MPLISASRRLRQEDCGRPVWATQSLPHKPVSKQGKNIPEKHIWKYKDMFDSRAKLPLSHDQVFANESITKLASVYAYFLLSD